MATYSEEDFHKMGQQVPEDTQHSHWFGDEPFFDDLCLNWDIL